MSAALLTCCAVYLHRVSCVTRFIAAYDTALHLNTLSVVRMTSDGRQLREVEQRALLLLNAASSGVSVLDDEELIDTLTEARVCY